MIYNKYFIVKITLFILLKKDNKKKSWNIHIDSRFNLNFTLGTDPSAPCYQPFTVIHLPSILLPLSLLFMGPTEGQMPTRKTKLILYLLILTHKGIHDNRLSHRFLFFYFKLFNHFPKAFPKEKQRIEQPGAP